MWETNIICSFPRAGAHHTILHFLFYFGVCRICSFSIHFLSKTKMVLGLLLVVLLLGVLLFVLFPNLTSDWLSPLNLILLRAPRSFYNPQIVHGWIPKPWQQFQGKGIPFRLAATSSSSNKNTLIIYSHAENEDLQSSAIFAQQMSQQLEQDILTYDYSGYGHNSSNSSERTADGFNITLHTVLKYAVDHLYYRAENIILWGHSLGCGPTVDQALHMQKLGTPVKGVILLRGFKSVCSLIEDFTGSCPKRWCTERWDNITKLVQLDVDVLIIHGIYDKQFPISHAENIMKACSRGTFKKLQNTTQWEPIGISVMGWLRKDHGI